MSGDEKTMAKKEIRIPTEIPQNGKRKRNRKPRPPSDLVVADSVAYVRTMYPSGDETEKNNHVAVRVFVTRPETLHMEYERTFHLGSRSYAKITVGMFVPHYVEEREAAFEDTRQFLEDKMRVEAVGLEQYQKDRDDKLKSGE